jgi:type I restriction enzyme R subunit
MGGKEVSNDNLYSSDFNNDQDLSEADTRAKFIDPMLKKAGWKENQIKREYQVSKGKIIKKNGKEKRKKAQYADYLLVYNDYPVAVIEAKKAKKSKDAGLDQGKSYAKKLGIQVVYSSNGYGVVEYDFSTHKQKFLNGFPSPEELWERIDLNDNIKEKESPLLVPYHKDPIKKMTPRYYQEIAINKTIENILNGENYILLTMATGTGKTYTAFQIVWKLAQSGYCDKVLFLADRNVLRNQAYNSFDAFDEGARCVIKNGKSPKAGKVFFSTYQALYSGEKDKLYQEYDEDFFDLIIIDECHRSGFGTWNEILQYFDSAIQLGLTATPKRSDNIDTYQYFGNPIYTYSMKQGIEDGYLATYSIFNIKTNLDAEGLDLDDLGIEAPEISRHYLTTKDYERIVTIPQRTDAMIDDFLNRVKSLDKFNVMDKTVIYCVNIDHAREVTRLINNKMAHLGIDNYAVPIVSEENRAEEHLEEFQDKKSKTPVMAVSVDMLTTGFDAPTLKNIVYFKPIGSEVVYKQIKGRGSRLAESQNKLSFNIFDYVDCTDVFEDPDFDGTPEEIEEDVEGELENQQNKVWSYTIKKSGLDFEDLPQKIKEDSQLQGAITTYQDEALPNLEKKMSGEEIKQVKDNLKYLLNTNEDDLDKLISDFNTQSKKDDSIIKRAYTSLKANHKPGSSNKKGGKVKVEKLEINNVTVYIKEKKYLEIDENGRQVTFEEYIDEVRENVRKLIPNKEKLYEMYSDPDRREELLSKLKNYFVEEDRLEIALDRFDAEFVDMINHVAFNGTLVSREERINAFKNKHQDFLEQFDDLQQRIIFDLLDKFKIGGVEQIDDPKILTAPPFNEYTNVSKVVKKFGGIDELRSILYELEEKLITVA